LLYYRKREVGLCQDADGDSTYSSAAGGHLREWNMVVTLFNLFIMSGGLTNITVVAPLGITRTRRYVRRGLMLSGER